jgi:hypothetical protein
MYMYVWGGQDYLALVLRPSRSIVPPLLMYPFINPTLRIKRGAFLMGHHGSRVVP